jgi:uncharacterized phage-associated protein
MRRLGILKLVMVAITSKTGINGGNMSKPTGYSLIADYFIGLANETGSLITNLKLQKLVYYAQAWSLALNDGQSLFDDDFEAWVHGPVIFDLYNDYRALKWNPIDKDVKLSEIEAKLDPETKTLLEEVAKVYFELDAYKLERLTHVEAPWIEARGSTPENEPCRNKIKKDIMRRYYASLVTA